MSLPYLDSSLRDDRLSGGCRRIPIETPTGRFEVWTKRFGNNPALRVLLLHGGPGCTHEYFEAADTWLPAAGVEYYYYDQLGSGWSDVPEDDSLWELPRFVDEVEQVRAALELDRDSFVLLGHSWGGILATEYALAHGEHLKGLVISNMMMDVPAYNAYAQKALMPTIDPQVLSEIQAMEASGDTSDPRFMDLLIEHHYVHHVLRMPFAEWPDPARRGIDHINPAIYVKMQGPSELGISASATLANWSRLDDLSSIDIPTLVIGAAHDTMDPAHMAEVARRLPQGSYFALPQWQPHGDVRRSGHLLPRVDQLVGRPSPASTVGSEGRAVSSGRAGWKPTKRWARLLLNQVDDRHDCRRLCQFDAEFFHNRP